MPGNSLSFFGLLQSSSLKLSPTNCRAGVPVGLGYLAFYSVRRPCSHSFKCIGVKRVMGAGAQRGVMPYNVGRRVLAAAFTHAIILRCDVFANGDHIGIDEVTATFGCR